MKKERISGYSNMLLPKDSPEYKFADRLKEQMRNKGMTQSDLAHQVGVSIETVKKWCQHRTFPEALSLGKLCEIFAPCSVDYFHGIIDAPDWNIQAAANITGLSPAAISALVHMNDNSRLIVSNILERTENPDDQTIAILRLIQGYVAVARQKSRLEKANHSGKFSLKFSTVESEQTMDSIILGINRLVESLLNGLTKEGEMMPLFQDDDFDDDIDVPF